MNQKPGQMYHGYNLLCKEHMGASLISAPLLLNLKSRQSPATLRYHLQLIKLESIFIAKRYGKKKQQKT